MFYIDLEPATNTKDVYRKKGLRNRIIEMEPPRRDKKGPAHMVLKARPYSCEKSRAPHDTKTYKKHVPFAKVHILLGAVSIILIFIKIMNLITIFKDILSQLILQYSMVLNMLTMLILF